MTEFQPLLPERGLIGREALSATVMAAVSAERLVTLTGPGGVGKTSIARRLAGHGGEPLAFPDGVAWVDLAAISAEPAVAQAVAHACAVAEQRDASWINTLCAALRSRRMLLILDNCEHVLAACATLSEALLAACPHLSILATSRQPLGVPGETRLAIPPLSIAAAVELFEARAAASRPGFALTGPALADVEAICSQLDGVPLAIELAAARVALLSVAQIAERMAQSLRLLSGGADRDPRQRSLRSVLDWSYRLLPAAAQHMLSDLAVFAGSFDFAAVEAVCTAAAPLDGLAALVETSLVNVLYDDPTVRYRLHDVVRQYAAERLGVDDRQDQVRTRHLAWVIALVERAEAEFKPASQDAWTARLARDHENIRAALQTAADRGDGDSVLRIAGALLDFWNSVSLREGRAWLAAGRSLGPAQTIVSVKAWNTESFLAYRQGDFEGTCAAATVALHEAEQLGYGAGIAAARYRLGIYAEMKHNTAAAYDHYRQCLALFTGLGDRRAMTQTLNGLAHVAKLDGDFRGARQYYRQGLALARADQDSLTTALLLISLANLTLDEGDLDAAEAAYAESLAHLRAINNASYVLYCVNGLGEVAHHRGQFALACEHYQEAVRLARALDLKPMEAQCLSHLGRTAVAAGHFQDAARWLSESLQLHLALGRRQRTAQVIHFCAMLVGALGYPAQATTLLAAGFRAAGVEPDNFAYIGAGDDRALLACARSAQAALDPAAYALAVADGTALSLDEAAELALSAVFLPQREPPAAQPATLRIFLFGQLRVERDGRALSEEDWVYARTKDVLLFLLLVDSATKAEIGAAIWPDASEQQLKHNFHIAIYHLRRALGRTDWIRFSRGRYAFNRSPEAWVDVAAFERAIERAASDPLQRAHHLRTAATLYAGELACGKLEGDLPLIRRERLHRQALDALLALGALHEERGQPAEAAGVYRRALALDRYGEAAQRGLLRSLARQGETAAALASYDQFASLLADELDVAPMSETADLAARIKRGESV